jgi:hypothetical protein
MLPYWDAVDAILGGAATMRKAGAKYLPKFPMEDKEDWDFRCKNAKFTNIFRDIVENLAAKPFTEEAGVDEKASDRIKTLAEDIDGKGNHLHVFAQSTFFNGIAYAIDWILVDYSKNVPENATIADEKRLGVRPYWVHVPAKRVIAVYSDVTGGKEILTHFRLREDVIERVGYGEVVKKRVRVFNREPLSEKDGGGYAPATWELFEEQKTKTGGAIWVSIDSGVVTIGVIPLVPFTTGRRCGSAWELVPSMQDAADLQIELFQQESGLKHAKENACFAMLSANGVEQDKDAAGNPVPLRVGPNAILYAPPRDGGAPGSWSFIEPQTTSLKFLAEDIEKTKQDLRELGRQPLTAQTGNLTVITTAFAAQKGNSAIQAWALNLKDALEQAFVLTNLWLKDSTPVEVKIDTDFDVGLDDDKGPDRLLTMRASRDLSARTLWHEMQRRGTLSPEFDADEEELAIASEVPDLSETDPVTGEPVDNKPKPGLAAA